MAADIAGGLAGDIVDAFQKQAKALAKSRQELEKAGAKSKESGKKESLIFFSDELDRCRPTFGIEMWQRMKHLFGVSNIVFVLSVDKAQLEASTAAVYGERINAPEYLRRFIDIEYALPLIRGPQFTEVLFERFMRDEIFAKRSHSELRYDRQSFIELFSLVADATQLSFRARERWLTRLRVVMDPTPENNFMYPPLVALMIVLRTIRSDLFIELKNGIATAVDVMTYLSGVPGGVAIVADQARVIMEIGLLLADENRERKQQSLDQLRKAAKAEKTGQAPGRASEFVEPIRYFQSLHSDGPRLRYHLDKIDLFYGLRNWSYFDQPLMVYIGKCALR